MRNRRLALSAAFALAAAVAACPALASAQGSTYTAVKKISLPGPAGHGDWVDYDAGNGYVYVAHHGQNVVIVDAKTDSIVKNIDDPRLKGANGVDHDAGYVYVAAGDANDLVVISKATWSIVNVVKTKGTSPDGVWVDGGSGRLYVASDDANDIEVYNGGADPKLITTWALQPAKPVSGPDVGVFVPSKGLLYEPDDALVEAINVNSGKIADQVDTHLKIQKLGATKGMEYDPATNRLWVATTDNEVLILNADTLQTVATAPATAGDDQMGFDPGRRLMYTFGGKGFDVYNADTMKRVASVDTGSPVTHTGAVDTATHHVYVYEGQANVLADYAQGAAASSGAAPAAGASLPKTGGNAALALLGAVLAAAGLFLGLRRPRTQP